MTAIERHTPQQNPALPAPAQTAPQALVEWANAASAAHQLARPLCQTDFVPAHFRGNEAAATAAILYGAEAGLSPLQALQGIFVIGGRPALYSRTMLAITLAAGHEVWTDESTDVRAVVCGRRRGTQNVERIIVTIDQAKKAGWTKNAKYNTEPAAMLLARAQSQACRRIAPDALLGMAYSAEEVEDDTTSTPVPAKRTARRQEPRPAAPEPAFDPDTGEVQEEPAEPAPEPDLPDDTITAAQLKKLHATMAGVGITDREDGLAVLSDIIGREVSSSKELTKQEASRVLDQFYQRRDVAQHEPLLDADEWPEVAQPGDGT